jgi:2-polyprenyl-6-methoxyphenol hydroxylase-like FAD-dependent oxidoreductase
MFSEDALIALRGAIPETIPSVKQDQGMAPHKIAIVGSGMAGLSAGMLLAKLGHHITLFERFDEPKSIGAGLLIQPSGLVALDRLGLRAEVEAKAVRIENFLGTTTGGRRVMDVRYAEG